MKKQAPKQSIAKKRAILRSVHRQFMDLKPILIAIGQNNPNTPTPEKITPEAIPRYLKKYIGMNSKKLLQAVVNESWISKQTSSLADLHYTPFKQANYHLISLTY